ncbi:hypothetical protein OKW41_004856 [Paraburkholderia sp. UCT70]|uniref:hypothetical protein n=1 Tax=Paraburkholderia sp. UCT70 TaxID=2991068 RepID=UPI003D20F9C9
MISFGAMQLLQRVVLAPARRLAAWSFAVLDRLPIRWELVQEAGLLLGVLAFFCLFALYRATIERVLNFNSFEYFSDTVGLVGWVWLSAAIIVPLLPRTGWLGAIRPAVLGIAIGLTPQIAFLIAYNRLLPRWTTKQEILPAIILGFERALLRLHLWLKPLEENGLLWIALVVCLGGMVALLRRRPAILTHSLETLGQLKYVSYVVVAAGCFTVGSSVAVGEYQPDVRLRLMAEEASEMRAAVGLFLAEHIRDEFRSGDSSALLPYAELMRAVAGERNGSGANSECDRLECCFPDLMIR